MRTVVALTLLLHGILNSPLTAAAASTLVHRYSFTANANDSVGTAHGTLQSGAAISGSAVVLDGASGYVDLPNGLVSTLQSCTFEVWLTDNGSGTWSRIFDFGFSTGGEDTSATGTNYLFLCPQTGSGTLSAAITPTSNGGEQIVQWPGTRLPGGVQKHVVWTIDAPAQTGRLYVDGVLVGENPAMTLTPAQLGNTVNNWIGRSQWSGDPRLNASITEFRIYDGALTAQEVQQDFTWGPDVAANGPVTILTQPQSQTVLESRPASFTVEYSGTPPVQLQWYRDNVAITGATNDTYTIASVALTNQGNSFKVLLTNTFNSTQVSETSSDAVLSVTADTTAPSLVGAMSLYPTEVLVLFSEGIRPDTATNIANYSITNSGGVLAITGARFGINSSNIILTTVAQSVGTAYTLTVNNLRDLSAASNLIMPNSQANFVATPFVVNDIGASTPSGALVLAGNGWNVSGGGTDVGGTRDQFQFSYLLYTGDFDVQVRLDSLSLASAWSEAGMVAREDLSPGARSAGVFATPGINGCYFQFRSATNGATTGSGSFPPNYPDQWLRLKRAGSAFTAYAGFDGRSWTQLGTATLAMPATLYFGFGVSSHNTNQLTTAAFRDFTNVTNSSIAGPLPFEPLGPSSRKSGLVISEIMYHPPPAAITGSLEFVEIYNSDLIAEDLSGYRLSGDIDFPFPAGTILPSGGFVVVARNPAALQSYYGISGVLGPFTNNLPNSSGTVRLRNELDGVLIELNYDSKNPWPASPDGAGHSLVLRRPSYGESDARAWAASDLVGGSPGRADGYGNEPLRGIVINEILAHTDLPELDSIELFNPGNQPVNLNGCILTDDPVTNRFVIGNVTIPARGFVYFTETQVGYRLDAAGETLYLKNAAQTRVIDAVRFEEQENGVAIGRYPDGADDWYRMASKTFGAANSAPSNSLVVLNEIMYSPLSGDDGLQYVELYNRGPGAVNLGGWELKDGISFTFASNTIVAAGGYVVVANNLSDLLTNYPSLNTNNTVGNFGGNLSHRGERIALTKPVPHHIEDTNGVVIATNTLNIVVDEVTFGDGGRWGQWSDGGGSSLELIDPRADRRRASNWADSDESAKAPWTFIERTSLAQLGMSTGGNGAPNRFEFFLQGPGECLVDDMECRNNGGTNFIANAGFESGVGSWAFQGTHNRSTVEFGGAHSGSQALHVRAVERGDTGANRVRTGISPLAVNGTNQVTLRAWARWLHGDPNILLRTRGNWLECAGVMTVPKNLGTPGAANSRLVPNAGPTIWNVSHWPILPAANEAVTVSARVQDPDGLGSVQLNYRVDPNAIYTTVNMTNDNGTYRGTIPGQASGALVAFVLSATDTAAATTTFPAPVFPPGDPPRECLVVFGETQNNSSLGSYRIWLTQANIDYWVGREKNSNDPLDATFAYGNCRVIYNVGTLYGGSPFHTSGYNGPLGGTVCNYIVQFPPDDQLLGTGDFSLESQSVTESGTFNNDITLQTENTAFWMGRKIGLAPDYRRYVFVYVNGQKRGMIYHDGQQPNGDVIEEYFPDDTNGHLHKIEDWFEFDDSGSGFSYITATLQNFTVNGQKRTERYRWNWRPRAVGGSPNDFNDLFALVNAVNANSPDPYTAATLNVMDVRQWTRVFALEHAVGNWDSYGYERGKNMYAYKPENGPWRLMLWDVQQIFNKGAHSTSESLFDVNDSVMTKLLTHPPFAREYWGALNEMVNGPMLASNYGPLMDARYAALLANGLPVQDPASVKTWIDARRSYILTQIPQASFTVSGAGSFSSPSNGIVLSGTAPVSAGGILINGGAYPITWTAFSNWSIRVTLTNAGLNTLVVQAVDRNGNAMPGLTATVNVTYTGAVVLPEGNVVFNEIMTAPALPGGGFIELLNTHPSYTFDLSHWRLNGLDYTFPAGSILGPRSFLVLAEDPFIFNQSYGITAFDQYAGNLDSDGETLTLLRPGATTNNEVVVDRVRYEATAPWPTVTNGVSLQLIDASQDNSRVANWGVVLTNSPAAPPAPVGLLAYNSDWKYMQTANLDGLNWTATNYNDAGWPSGPGLLAFENNATLNPLINTALNDPQTGAGLRPGHADYFRTRVVLTNSPVGYRFDASAYVDDGAVIYVNGGAVTPRIRMNAGVVTNGTLANGTPGSGDATSPDALVLPASLFKIGTNVIAVEVHQQATNSSDIVFGMQLTGTYTGVVSTISIATPGRANANEAALSPFPPFWLNEVQAENVTGPFDNAGQRDPWVELYNPATTNVSLNGYYLTDTYTNLTKWAFPADVTIGPLGFSTVWCDSEVGQTTAGSPHASFRLPNGSGTVALTRIADNSVQVIDYLNYTAVPPNWSYGDVPDGQPFYRQTMFATSPGGTNSGSSAPITIFINEWMADNSATLRDPADNNYEDWFELYNPGSSAVDLGGYFLTDTLTNKFQFQVPNNAHYLVPAGGFLLVWADNESGQNNTNRADLHVNFALSKGGEAIGLFAPDGTQIDAVIFGGQTTDVSQGRFPDGLGSTFPMSTPTPGAPNVVPELPQFNSVSVSGGTVSFTLSVTPGRSYRIEYKNDLSTGSWIPLLPDQIGVIGPVLFQDPVGTNQQRFYRIIQLD